MVHPSCFLDPNDVSVSCSVVGQNSVDQEFLVGPNIEEKSMVAKGPLHRDRGDPTVVHIRRDTTADDHFVVFGSAKRRTYYGGSRNANPRHNSYNNLVGRKFRIRLQLLWLKYVR